MRTEPIQADHTPASGRPRGTPGYRPLHAAANVAVLGYVLAGCSAGTAADPPTRAEPASAALGSSERIAAKSAATMTAARSNDLYGACGVNTHLAEFAQTQYGNQPLVASLLSTLNCPNVRESFADFAGGNTFTVGEMASLAANQHVRFDYVTDPGQTVASLQSAETTMGSAMKSGEGINEADGGTVLDWQAVAPAAQQTLYSALHPGGIATYSTTIVGASDATMLGNLSEELDSCAIHDYVAGRNPGTAGFGAYDAVLKETYGSEAYVEAYSKNFCGSSAPFVSTESGYGDTGSTDLNSVPSDIKAAYTVRTLLYHWLNGIDSTYFYELKDDFSPGFTSFGLADMDGNPKPAFIALENCQLLDADPNGTTFSPTPLEGSIAGAGSDVQHVLVERGDKSYLLWLWRENEDYNVNAASYETANQGAESVTLKLAEKPSGAETFQLNGDGSVTTTTLTPSASFAIAVDWLPVAVRIGSSPYNPSFAK